MTTGVQNFMLMSIILRIIMRIRRKRYRALKFQKGKATKHQVLIHATPHSPRNTG